MRILFYNWVPYDDPERRGGGIRHYENGLIDHVARHTDHEITVLSSGLEHDAVNRQIRIEQTRNSHPGRVRSFSLINSLVPAPGHHAFGSPWLFDEQRMLPVWHRFLAEHGPFDVIQFDSLEGIPFTFLRVHEQAPETRVVLYAHNYYMLCPQVNLWKRELTHCTDFRQGRDCVSCIPNLANPREVVRAHQLSRVLRAVGVVPGTRSYRRCYQLYGLLRRIRRLVGRIGGATPAASKPSRTGRNGHPTGLNGSGAAPVLLSLRAPSALPLGRSTPSVFVKRRIRGLELINHEVDLVLATSQRVKEVLGGYGIAAEKIAVAYIGTRAAEAATQANHRTTLTVPGQLTLAYLGYARPDKGFPFLLDTLERCPDETRSRLRLVVAALGADPLTLRRLVTLAGSMVDVEYCDGYTQDHLPELLRTADVGVVPVQWEDCLPQVAIEMVANGVPVITSHRGGAKELGGSNPAFTFTATNHTELIDIWRQLLHGELSPADYWHTATNPTTMTDHLARLTQLYASAPEEVRSPSRSA